MSIRILTLILLFFILSCSQEEEQGAERQKTEAIHRQQNEREWAAALPQQQPLPLYSWENIQTTPHSYITKEFFRCKGSALNPPRFIQKNAHIRLDDCGGSASHSLPLKNQKEFIYPILIDLLNFLQEKTQRKVVITCGHRCPQHHFYAKSEIQNRYSKHMIGAEVAFYIAGMEHEPENVVSLLMDYYGKQGEEYTTFQRYTKADTDVSTPPWYNKEIFIKMYLADEGRDFDNRHPYPYLRIQVRYDRDSKQRVIFKWDEAENNILKY